MLRKIKMTTLFSLLLPFYFLIGMNTFAQTLCHPMCRWECDNPVCPSICDTVCGETLCQEVTSCDAPTCECASYGQLETFNCIPLANDCPLCDVGRAGIDCVDDQQQSCSCTAQCQTRECEQVCHKPACPKPKCELVCEDPLCPRAE